MHCMRLLLTALVLTTIAAAAPAQTKVVVPFQWDLPFGFPVPNVPADNPMSDRKSVV